VAQAKPAERAQVLDAMFDLSREEVVRRVEAGAIGEAVLAAHDYVYDIFPGGEAQRQATGRSAAFESEL
jgi:hypothetical protein